MRLAAILVGLALTGCGTGAPTPSTPAAPPNAAAAPTTPVALVELPKAPVWVPPDTPFTADLPTFTRSQMAEPIQIGPRTVPMVFGDENTLRRIADQLRSTGKPPTPDPDDAKLVGTLPGERYIYYLGGYPQHGVYEIYQFRRDGDNWVVSPLCMDGPWPIWPVSPRVAPLFICGLQEGSGAVLSLAAYRDDREVLRIAGIINGGLAIQEDPSGGPPQLIVTGTRQWLDHKLDPKVTERYTFAWQGEKYALVRHERLDDSFYHQARFFAFLAAGNDQKAAREWQEPPEDGILAQAPDLRQYLSSRWTTQGRQGGYLRPAGDETAPWFRFTFDPQTQRIIDITEEN